ncbi:Uncharacterized protein YifN, PemK superfamily [Duganella sp. CF402]|uniref:type II toxin-antitoxin system PemK/MazF family toxin n=1 Tax=unclassified Duganella TaxID=2636909 RepID=UPI0008C8C1E5|nr:MULTISPECIES: type II toxin-antitoxin system PemK/MazF family toxin [unclassified Duganella]RZT05367.1 uncharacterized protein YifN (PemK superfamily) [Duganella sp. BK701]SEN10392.1 Uncharacterized protein YifN, PemK superfamily [Duganella sp. CF402]
MKIPFYPEQGTVLVCDFKGFIESEMVKRRPVIVVSPKRKHGPRLVTVIPTSTTAPRPAEKFHFKITFDPPLPDPYSDAEFWIKCDMIYQVSLDRLTLPRIGRDENKRRMYDQRVVSSATLHQIQNGIAMALGLI